MEFFERQWRTYRGIVDHNLMEHRQVAEATAAALQGWLAERPPAAPAPQMVDLGCGDLALLAPLLRQLPLGSYTALDQAAAVLPLAEAALGPVPYPTRWLEGDLLAWATGEAPGELPREGGAGAGAASDPPAAVDILHSAFAIHHLSDAEKGMFLRAARRRLAPGGLFLWADVFREPGEALAPYLERYRGRMRGWQALSPPQQDQAIAHVSRFDRPAERGVIEALAAEAGWSWQWIWRGSHNAEALAVLTPI